MSLKLLEGRLIFLNEELNKYKKEEEIYQLQLESINREYNEEELDVVKLTYLVNKEIDDDTFEDFTKKI